jgi:hypothetical protein
LGTPPPKVQEILFIRFHKLLGTYPLLSLYDWPQPTVSSSLTIIGRWKNQRKLQVERKSTAHDHPLIHESMTKGMSQAGNKIMARQCLFFRGENFAILWNISKKNILSQIPYFFEENKFH